MLHRFLEGNNKSTLDTIKGGSCLNHMFARGIVEISVFSDATNVDFQRKVKKIKLSHSDLKYEKKKTLH